MILTREMRLMRKHGLIFTSINTVSGRVSLVQHSSIWSYYTVCRENTANISFTTALRFPLCLCFPHWYITGFLSLSVDMLPVCQVQCGLPGGTPASLQPFLVTVSHNWPPASHQSVLMYVSCCAYMWTHAAHFSQTLGWSTDPCAWSSPELLWRHSVSL